VGAAALTLAIAAVALVARGARAGECAPAQIKGDPTSLPAAWQRALAELVAATAREGQPWSCPGATITLTPPSDSGFAHLEIEDSAGVRRRSVASPADVVPLGEALLARIVVVEVGANPGPPPPPLPPRPPPPGLQEPLVAPPLSARRMPERPMHEPTSGRRLLADALLGVRYTGPTRGVLMGPELRALVADGAWSGGLVARYDASVAIFQPVPPHFSLSSVTIGLAGGYRMLKAPVEIVAALEPTLAVVFMGAQRPGDVEPDVDAHVDLRLGARLGMTVPIHGRLRMACALSAEGAPAALFTDRDSRRHELPELPGYLAGLSVGLELEAIR
jgi:hypothetical protein